MGCSKVHWFSGSLMNHYTNEVMNQCGWAGRVNLMERYRDLSSGMLFALDLD